MELPLEDEEFLEDEIICQGESGTAEDNEFDFMVGALEEILMSEEFTNVQNSFCNLHCDIFEDNEENKLEYMDLFQEYTNIVEREMDARLRDKSPGYNLNRFEELISTRQDEISGEVFDLLMSLGDFSEFKQLMLSYKKTKINSDAFGSLSVSGDIYHLVSNSPAPNTLESKTKTNFIKKIK